MIEIICAHVFVSKMYWRFEFDIGGYRRQDGLHHLEHTEGSRLFGGLRNLFHFQNQTDHLWPGRSYWGLRLETTTQCLLSNYVLRFESTINKHIWKHSALYEYEYLQRLVHVAHPLNITCLYANLAFSEWSHLSLVSLSSSELDGPMTVPEAD